MTLYQEDSDLVFQKVCALLEPINKVGVKLTGDTNLVADLEIDSVAVLDLIMEIEDQYDISLPMHVIAETKTIGELVDTIHATKREQESDRESIR